MIRAFTGSMMILVSMDVEREDLWHNGPVHNNIRR